MTAGTDELVRRLRHLVSLHEPKYGGPYQGYAAESCVKAMQEAADILEQKAALWTKVYAINAHGRQLLPVKTIKEAVEYCQKSPYFVSLPPMRIVVQESRAVEWPVAVHEAG